MCTGVTRLFSPSGVVASAFDTASTFEDGSAEASFGGSLDSFGNSLDSFDGGGTPGCLEEYGGTLLCGGVCFGSRARGPGGGGVRPVANVRMACRGSRKYHLAAGNISTVCCRNLVLKSEC